MKILSTIFKEEISDYLFNMRAAVFGRLLLTAAVAGLLVWLVATGIDRAILEPIVCKDGANQLLCGNSTMMAGHIATVIMAIMLVPVLILFGIKRPLVVVLAATIALWGVNFWQAHTIVAALIASLTYMVVYASLTWLNRIRGDGAAILLMIVFVILARVVLSL